MTAQCPHCSEWYPASRDNLCDKCTTLIEIGQAAVSIWGLEGKGGGVLEPVGLMTMLALIDEVEPDDDDD